MRIGYCSNEPYKREAITILQSCHLMPDFVDCLLQNGNQVFWLSSKAPEAGGVENCYDLYRAASKFTAKKWKEKFKLVKQKTGTKMCEYFVQNWEKFFQNEDNLFSEKIDKKMPHLDWLFMDYADVGIRHDFWQFFLLWYYTYMDPCPIFILDDDLKLWIPRYDGTNFKHPWGRLSGIYGKIDYRPIVDNCRLFIPALKTDLFSQNSIQPLQWNWWMSKNDDRTINAVPDIDLIYGGSDYDRRPMFQKYYGNLSLKHTHQIIIYGNWNKYPNKHRYPDIQFRQGLKKNLLVDFLNRSVATMHLAPVRYAKIGMYTPRIFECTAAGVVVFLPKEIEGIELLDFPKFCYVESVEELDDKLRQLKENAYLRQNVIQLQREILSCPQYSPQYNYDLIQSLL